MKYLLLLLAVVGAAYLSSCSSSTSTTPATPNYYKGLDSLGSYWIFENHDIDTNNVVSSTYYTDSMWVAGHPMVDGKMSNMLISLSTQNGKQTYDTTYLYHDGNKLFAYVQLPSIPMLDTSSAVPSSTWMLVSNFDATGSWLLVDTVSVSQDATISGVAVSVNVKTWINATRYSDTTFTAANGTSYKTHLGSVDPMVNGAITPKAFPLPQAIVMTGGNQYQYFADGVGLVCEKVTPRTITVGSTGLIPPIKSAGSLRTLLRYHVN